MPTLRRWIEGEYRRLDGAGKAALADCFEAFSRAFFEGDYVVALAAIADLHTLAGALNEPEWRVVVDYYAANARAHWQGDLAAGLETATRALVRAERLGRARGIPALYACEVLLMAWLETDGPGYAGEVEAALGEFSPDGLAPDLAARMGLVRSFQISAVFPHLTSLENVRVALQRKMGNSFHFWKSERQLQSLDGKAGELLEAVGLGQYRHIPAVELPYGRKRALEIATTLALEPDMMLLDEPMAGMGHEDIERTQALIRRVAKDRTVLMVEHNMKVVANLSDTITVLARGEVLAEGTYAEVSRNPAVIQAYMGSTVHAHG